MTELLSVARAEALIRENTNRFGTETVPLTAAMGRVLRQTVRAERALPPFDRVMMDGVACRLEDGASLRIAGMQAAGAPPRTLPEGAVCLEVTTGAVLPQGADTVIPVERLVREGDNARLQDGYAAERGQFIHRQGADCAAAEELLAPGVRLNAPAMAVLASNGVSKVEVAQIPSIGIISTGNELVAPEDDVAPWQIRRSNEYALAGALHARGFTRHDFALVQDDLAATTALLEKQLARHDVLVLSGGVSMGEYDYVPRALAALGVDRIFHKIAQRPGKPMWFGVGPQGQRVFALPGNPVSALVCGVRYVVPALLEAQGLNAPFTFPIRLQEPVARIPTLTRFVPVRLHHDEQGQALGLPRPMTTSGDFNRLSDTDGFVALDPGPGEAQSGDIARFYAW
ncbi:molybdopterin molybdotransferase MoeA [Kozakia baliensis]|uniref:molybdopterin molybdotransferase MoeA n=1 Tax=Kozakia baliensis TaxID=153496 RepID=UPI0004962918|nr:molybdopterin molybdotransferase MoeA [Kozakia baliensis]